MVQSFTLQYGYWEEFYSQITFTYVRAQRIKLIFAYTITKDNRL